MMSPQDIVWHLLKNKNKVAVADAVTAFAPVNIALIKYWGKRDDALNLPITNSLSVTLPNQGSVTTLRIHHHGADHYYLNQAPIKKNSEFAQRLQTFCDLFRFEAGVSFEIHTTNTIPTAAGLASSASGFAALVLAFDQLFAWQLEKTELSILARLGSGSACRSLWPGVVEWQRGEREDGLDSYALPLDNTMATFLSTHCLGLLILEQKRKKMSSRQAMRHSVATSPAYKNWPQQVAYDLAAMKKALAQHNFSMIGAIAERNALAMHATLQDSQPKTDYCTQQTYAYRQKIWRLRRSGWPVYFTQDAGPNLKLLFPKKIQPMIQQEFLGIEVIEW